MAYTLNRRLAQLVDSNGQLNTGKIPNDYITSDHVADNTITSAMLHTSFTVSTSNLTAIDTDDVSEGSSNLYYTNARVDTEIDSYLSGGTGVTYSSGAISIGQDVGTSATPTFGNITTTGYIAGPATFTIDPAAVGNNTGTVVIAGNLQVDGTTTTINSTTMTVDDLNLTLASGAANAAAANGAGITVDCGSDTDATFIYDGTNDEWDFNKAINVTGTITASGNITGTLATAAQTNITSVGTLTSLNTSGSVTLDKSVASGNFLTDATIYPLRLTNDDTTAGNTVGISFGQGGFDFTNFIASVRTGTGDNPKGDLVFGGRPSDGNAFVERMRIQANGHVGIGTNQPSKALDISNTTSAKINLQGGTNQNGIRFTAAGDDGVSSSTYYLGVGSDLMGGTDYGAVLLDVTNNRSVLFDDQSTSRLGFYNNSMVINSSGKVGIGTTSPTGKLTIANPIAYAPNTITAANSYIQLGSTDYGSGGSSGNDGKFMIGFGYTDGTTNTHSPAYIGFEETSTSGDTKGELTFYTRDVITDTAPTERMRITDGGFVGIGTNNPNATLHLKSTTINSGPSIIFENTNNAQTMDIDYYSNAGSVQSRIQYSEGPGSFSFFPDVTSSASLVMDYDGVANFHANRNEYGITISSAGNRSGLVLEKPGTSTVMGSALLLASDETYRLGTASNYHIKMDQSGNTYFGDSTNNSHFNSNGNLFFEHGGAIGFEAASNDYSTQYSATGYASQGYNTSLQRYWNHMISKGGTHITINSDGGHTQSENTFDDFVVWQGTPDAAEPLFRVSNAGRVIAKRNYEIGNHKTNKEDFGVSAINTVDTATSDINTTTTNTYENRPGVYWLNYNSKRFRAFIKPNWLQNRNWVLAAKFFSHMDMPSGSALWTNDESWNGGDFDLNNGHFSKYGNVWRYFGFNRLAMQMGDRVAPIMQFSSTQTLYGAFSGGRANNGGGVSPSSTDPALSTGATYHGMTNYLGGTFTDLGGLEDKMQSYGLNKWANASTNSTSANNQGSRSLTAGGKGFELTVEDSHDNIGGNDSVGRAGAWIGCPLDEGNCNPLSTSSNAGADSGFGFGGGCGNNARTWTSGIAEWQRGNEVANYLPAYIWLSID